VVRQQGVSFAAHAAALERIPPLQNAIPASFLHRVDTQANLRPKQITDGLPLRIGALRQKLPQGRRGEPRDVRVTDFCARRKKGSAEFVEIGAPHGDTKSTKLGSADSVALRRSRKSGIPSFGGAL